MPGHREDIPEIMAALDIHCLASFAVEGTSHQALAMKTLVISTRMSSIPPILGSGAFWSNRKTRRTWPTES